MIWKSREHLGGRPLLESTLKYSWSWIAECIGRHEKCKRSPYHGYFPTRLIDVGPSDGSREPFLCETKEISRNQDLRTSINPIVPKKTSNEQTNKSSPLLQYATLSHRWGESRNLKTTIKMLGALKSSIPISSMSRTFVNAVNVTRSIGLQYLWIDSLCIIQDSTQDWQQESSKMCAIYSNAIFNIAATSSSNGDEGFLHPRPTAVQVPQKINAQESLDRRMPSKALWLRPVVPDVNTLMGRAWYFQEVILAPRSLNFGYNEVNYYCRVCRRFERTPEQNGPDNTIHFHREPEVYKREFSTLLREDIVTEDKYRDAMRLWHEMVDSYSSRQLTFPKDKLPAISGLASLLGFATKDHYLAGLWSRDLPFGLCWRVYDPDGSQKVKPYRAPSWSWVSQSSTIDYGAVGLHDYDWDVSVLDFGVDSLSDDEYGQVQGGFIKLEGSMMQVDVEEAEGDGYSRFSCFLRRGDVGLCDEFPPDDYRLDSEVEELWCLLLGVRILGSERYLLLLVVIKIDDEATFERVGYIDDSYTSTESLWKGIERTHVTLL